MLRLLSTLALVLVAPALADPRKPATTTIAAMEPGVTRVQEFRLFTDETVPLSVDARLSEEERAYVLETLAGKHMPPKQ